MKRIAVITGASSGIGRRFALTVNEFGKFDEIWVIARREELLEELKPIAPYPVRTMPMDLADKDALDDYALKLSEEKPCVGLLVNASGYGIFRGTADTPLADNLDMVDINCKAVMALCQHTIPYMPEGGQIINMASVAAYQPIPYINVYAATKAFVLSYSRALNRELKPRGIRVMAVCPFWTKTGFFSRAVDESTRPVVKKYIAMYQPEDIVSRAWKDALKGRDMSKYGFIARAQGAAVKLLPHKIVMDVWMRQQDL